MDTPPYRDLSRHTTVLRWLLGLGAAVAGIAMLSSFLQIELLSRSYLDSEAQANDLREQIVGVLQLTLYLGTAVVFGRWIYRAHQNVRALGAEGLRTTPGWAVGYFFVPIVNLWRPYQAMKELWMASRSPGAWRAEPVEATTLPAWWGLWILSNVLGRVSFRAIMRAETVESIRSATYLQLAEEAVDAILCLAALSLVTQIYRALQASAALAAGPETFE